MPASEIICDRLQELEKILGLSPDEMARLGNCSRSTYYRYRKGESTPDLDFLNNILRNENSVNAEWLLSGKEPVLDRNGKESHPDKEHDAKYIRFINLPLYHMKPIEDEQEGRLPVSDWEETSENLPLCSFFVNSVLDVNTPSHLFAMTIECDSMYPEIKSGSLIIGNKNETDPTTDGLYVVRIDNVLRMKQIQRLPSRRLLLSTINPKFNEMEVSMENNDFEIIGRIIWRGSKL